MTLGLKIKEMRKHKGLTQKQLGTLCGIADSNIRKYENGQQNPKIETLRKIANALDVSVIENNGHFELIDKNQIIVKSIDHISPEILASYPDLDQSLKDYTEELFANHYFSRETDIAITTDSLKDLDLNHRAELYNSIFHHINIKIMNGIRYFDVYPMISHSSVSDLFCNNLQKICQKLNGKGKRKLINYAEDLSKIPEYQSFVHAHAGRELTFEDTELQHNLDIAGNAKTEE